MSEQPDVPPTKTPESEPDVLKEKLERIHRDLNDTINALSNRMDMEATAIGILVFEGIPLMVLAHNNKSVPKELIVSKSVSAVLQILSQLNSSLTTDITRLLELEANVETDTQDDDGPGDT